MKAILKTYRQSPRKVRLVADMVRGKQVSHALSVLRFSHQRASRALLKLVESALANAKALGVQDIDSLRIGDICVDKGATLKRWMPRARGRASRINKRTSHIAVSLIAFPEKAHESVASHGTKAPMRKSQKELAVKEVKQSTPV